MGAIQVDLRESASKPIAKEDNKEDSWSPQQKDCLFGSPKFSSLFKVRTPNIVTIGYPLKDFLEINWLKTMKKSNLFALNEFYRIWTSGFILEHILEEYRNQF